MARSELFDVPRACRMEGIRVPSLPGIDFEARVTDPEGKPVEGLAVEIWGKQQNPPIGLKGKTATDGVLRVPRLPTGGYQIRGQTSDYDMSFGQDLTWTGEEGRPEFRLVRNRR